ncbi:MAG: flippase-like domain-containing protein, partial [Halobacteriota archaeon]|nr:flippase-like domain-containing protein [Halobacteriota archaeon]
RFMKNGKMSLLIAMIFTSLFWLAEVSIASLILIGLGMAPMWSASFSAQIILAVFITIPITPGSSGVAELGITSLYGTLVTSSAMLGLFVLIWRFVTYYINFIIGGIAGGVLSFKILRDLE